LILKINSQVERNLTVHLSHISVTRTQSSHCIFTAVEITEFGLMGMLLKV